MQNDDFTIDAGFTVFLFYVFFGLDVGTCTFVWVVAMVAFDSYCFHPCWEVWNDIQITVDDSEPLHDSCDTTVIRALYNLIGVALYH